MDHQDAKLNRKLVGFDRYNNRYYQYYDDSGNETKREAEFPSGWYNEDELDQYWFPWLKKMEKDPPTPEFLKQVYAEDEEMKRRAYDYELRDAKMMNEYR